MNDVNAVSIDQLACHSPSAALANQATGKADREIAKLARKLAAELEQDLLKPRVRNEMDTIQILAKERGQFFTCALVNQQPCLDAALPEDAEIMKRQDRLAPEPCRRMLGNQ